MTPETTPQPESPPPHGTPVAVFIEDAPGHARDDDSVDLMHLLTLFVARWPIFLLTAFVLFAVGAGIIYSITPLYEASATLLPQGQEQSASVAALFANRSPGDILLGLLGSRSVADEVVDRSHLLERYHTTSRGAARGTLGARTVFTIGRDTLVVIKVRDKDAEAARQITNAYLEGLESQREKIVATQAALNNRFYQDQLSIESEALADAEQQLKAVQEKTGLVAPEAQTSIGLNAIAGIRSQITSLQVQLSSLLLGESEQNPQVQALRAQIAQLEAQERRMESASSAAGAPAASGAAAAAGRMPELNLDYARKLRIVRYHEAIFSSISNQYEAARLSQAYTGTPFVVIDRAIVPEYRAYPDRHFLLYLALGGSIFAGFAVVASLLLWRRLQADPVQRDHFHSMRNSFRFSR